MVAFVSPHAYMKDNWFGEDGAQEFARVLEHNTSISHVDVSVRMSRRV